MNLLAVEWLGLIGGAIGTIGFLPQVIRIFKLKSAHEISLLWSISFVVGIGCWLSYGIILELTPIILWNSITIVLALALIYAKLKYGR
ncbi:MAG: SemiSWEET family transporter [Chloroflexi bacterium]|nr:SemiSWEET family transporter [Chloroflexota bacterium]